MLVGNNTHLLFDNTAAQGLLKGHEPNMQEFVLQGLEGGMGMPHDMSISFITWYRLGVILRRGMSSLRTSTTVRVYCADGSSE